MLYDHLPNRLTSIPRQARFDRLIVNVPNERQGLLAIGEDKTEVNDPGLREVVAAVEHLPQYLAVLVIRKVRRLVHYALVLGASVSRRDVVTR